MPFFNRTSPSPPRESVDSRSSSGSSGFLGLGRNKGLDSDPGIIAARQQIAEAERKEREADAALQQARRSAAAARETIRVLEREAQLEFVSSQ